MSKRKAVISDRSIAFYDRMVADAVSRDEGAYMILGVVQGIMQGNADGYRSDAETLAHLRYVLQSYHTAFKATLPQ